MPHKKSKIKTIHIFHKKIPLNFIYILPEKKQINIGIGLTVIYIPASPCSRNGIAVIQTLHFCVPQMFWCDPEVTFLTDFSPFIYIITVMVSLWSSIHGKAEQSCDIGLYLCDPEMLSL